MKRSACRWYGGRIGACAATADARHRTGAGEDSGDMTHPVVREHLAHLQAHAGVGGESGARNAACGLARPCRRRERLVLPMSGP